MRKAIVTLIIIISGVLLFYLFSTTSPTDPYKDLWPFVGAIATILLWLVALQELAYSNKIAKTDFAHRFTLEFNREETRDLVMLFNHNALKFKIKNIEVKENDSNSDNISLYFEIQKDILTKLVVSEKKKKEFHAKSIYTAFEVDDFMLGYFEEMAALEKRGMLTIEVIYDNFDFYFDFIWNNEEIKKYIMYERENEKDGEDIYEDFEYIVDKCDSYGKAKLAKKWIWLWKVKWNLYSLF